MKHCDSNDVIAPPPRNDPRMTGIRLPYGGYDDRFKAPEISKAVVATTGITFS